MLHARNKVSLDFLNVGPAHGAPSIFEWSIFFEPTNNRGENHLGLGIQSSTVDLSSEPSE